MKKNLLLTVLSILFIPIINNSKIINNYQKHQLTIQTSSITWSFNEEDKTETVETSYSKKLIYTRILFTTIDIGVYPWNLGKMTVIGANDCYSKVSWGRWPYYGTSLPQFLANKSFADIAQNAMITSDNIGNISNHEILNVKDYDGSAVFIAKEFIGFAWHYNNDLKSYILAMSFYFYAETWGSGVGGAMWMNIGEGLKIELNN